MTLSNTSIPRVRSLLETLARQTGRVLRVLSLASAAHLASSPAIAREAWTQNRVVGSPYPPAPYTVERAFPELAFDHPVDLALMPGSTRAVVADQGGGLWWFDTAATPAKKELLLQLRDTHKPFDSVLGFTFHPGFATNRFMFVNYNEPGGRTNGSFVSRFTFSSLNPPQLDPKSEKIIIQWLSGGHNGCGLAFGNDGFLYISTGDAASPDPPDMPYRTGQDISDLLASVLRIDVDHPDTGKGYSIPKDNPFVHLPGARPEVWAFGFRNPFRISIDKATGDAWLADVGWEQWEMVHRVVKGGNYGWSITEGPNLKVRTDVAQGPGPILPPMAAISHTDGASITGGFVYHGSGLPPLKGAYIYGDWETGRFWALRQKDGKTVSNIELCDTALKPVAFAPDVLGEPLILDYNGTLHRFKPNQAASANRSFPTKLSQTGIFTSLTPPTPAPGVMPYRVKAPMWNDHARADWLVAVPGEGAIATEGGVGNIAGATWYFPENTVFVRTLTLELEAGKPNSNRPIETQLLHWDGQAWNPYSFRWNSAGTDAELVPSQGVNEVYKVADASAPGGVRETHWRFMSRSECLRCHNAWAGEVISLNYLQLGPPAATRSKSAEPNLPSETARLEAAGLLLVKNPPAEVATALANPYDPAAPTPLRARSWLHANCSGCHRFGAGGSAALHLNADKNIEEARLLDEKPGRGDFGLLEARVVASGDPYRSTLFYRARTEGSGHMPYIGTRLVDEVGTALLRDWILGLPSRPKAEPPSAELTRSNSENKARLARLVDGTDPDPDTSLSRVLSTVNGTLQLLQEIKNPNLRIKAAKLGSSQPNALVRDLMQQWLAPADRRKTLGTEIDPSTILSLTGSVVKGRELFNGVAQCSRCHALEGQGRAWGPDLAASIQKYSRAQLLDQILFPSRIIAPDFVTSSLTLHDDTEINGFILKRTPDLVSIKDDTLVVRSIPRTSIKESRDSALSAMPDGLLAPLTAQEAADLLDYLVSLSKK